MSGKHPSFGVGDFTIVEDIRSGDIVSSMNLIDQTWTYAGIPFEVGRPELVGTLPAHRNRGLVRKQFEVIHLVESNNAVRSFRLSPASLIITACLAMKW